jgi:hypothetical protein
MPCTSVPGEPITFSVLLGKVAFWASFHENLILLLPILIYKFSMKNVTEVMNRSGRRQSRDPVINTRP